jgi:serine-type D-Ala-D-Ala carboxypeptidase/endopeptidase (penicillin-binding protein 4)
MLDLFTSGLVSFWLQNAKITSPQVDFNEFILWKGAPLLTFPSEEDSFLKSVKEQYLKELSTRSMKPENQFLWLQSASNILLNHQGNTPVPAASISKVATTLTALEKLGIDYKFITKIAKKGTINNGVLQGDLIIIGSGDPLFVWEEAIALGNTLNDMGIKTVTGNLIIVGNFYMNYKLDPKISGELLKQSFDSKKWTPIINNQYVKMTKSTAKPQIEIKGNIQITNTIPENNTLIEHQSLSLVKILKEMNIYSNNDIAEMLTKSIGNSDIIRQTVIKSAQVPSNEIQMINGSGLTMKNLISPRVACQMFMAIERYLRPHNLTIADVFPVSGIDKQGTLSDRNVPKGTIIKTGTLNEVSALVGVLPTKDKGLIWFALINGGTDIGTFRKQQDILLQNIVKKWGVADNNSEVLPAQKVKDKNLITEGKLGDNQRNIRTYTEKL